jgi:hypothetical protein
MSRTMSDKSETCGRFARGVPWAALALALAAGGCVERRMTIRSNPPGALVYVDNVEIGTTPVSHSFLYYGTREIRLVKAGYETLTLMQPIAAPWYQVPPLDFVSDNVTPWETRDEREFVYQLTPARQVPTDQLLSRAEQLRGGTVAASPAGPAPAAPPAAATSPDRLPPPSVPPSAVVPPTTGAPPPLPGFPPIQPRSPRRVWPTP